MSLTPSKYLKFLIFVKLLIQRYQFIGITLSKPHLECTFYDKQINVKKYEWKFGSVQILLVGDCSICLYMISFRIFTFGNTYIELSSRRTVFITFNEVNLGNKGK